MGDSITNIAQQSFGGFLSAVGESFAPKAQTRAADVSEAEKKGKWDWRMIGVIGAVAVVLVVLVMRRK
jgi:hypothetical protein